MKKIGFASTLALGLWLHSPLLTILHAQNSSADLPNAESDASQTRHHPRFKFKVGHRVMKIVVPGSVVKCQMDAHPPIGECRQVDVHLWYPADLWDYFNAPPTQYTSSLNGKALDLIAEATGGPPRWDPLSWSVASLRARERPSIFRWAPKFPVIVFSHGSTNVPIDYALTMEDLASAGFVVAAPTHVNNSQDDVRMDFANAEVLKAGYPPPIQVPGWPAVAMLSPPGAPEYGRPGAGHHLRPR